MNTNGFHILYHYFCAIFVIFMYSENEGPPRYLRLNGPRNEENHSGPAPPRMVYLMVALQKPLPARISQIADVRCQGLVFIIRFSFKINTFTKVLKVFIIRFSSYYKILHSARMCKNIRFYKGFQHFPELL